MFPLVKCAYLPCTPGLKRLDRSGVTTRTTCRSIPFQRYTFSLIDRCCLSRGPYSLARHTTKIHPRDRHRSDSKMHHTAMERRFNSLIKCLLFQVRRVTSSYLRWTLTRMPHGSALFCCTWTTNSTVIGRRMHALLRFTALLKLSPAFCTQSNCETWERTSMLRPQRERLFVFRFVCRLSNCNYLFHSALCRCRAIQRASIRDARNFHFISTSSRYI